MFLYYKFEYTELNYSTGQTILILAKMYEISLLHFDVLSN